MVLLLTKCKDKLVQINAYMRFLCLQTRYRICHVLQIKYIEIIKRIVWNKETFQEGDQEKERKKETLYFFLLHKKKGKRI